MNLSNTREWHREDFNKGILTECINLLKSHVYGDIFHGTILAAYLIENSFKSELKSINPLLLFDRNLSTEQLTQIVKNKLTVEDMDKIKSVSASRCIEYLCLLKTDLLKHRQSIEELFRFRNVILHSTNRFVFDEDIVAETAVSALRYCKKYVIKHCQVSPNEFNPLTSAEFNKLQDSRYKKRLNDLKKVINLHREEYLKLSKTEVAKKIVTNYPHVDQLSWVEETNECPSCHQDSLDKIGSVDFDWSPDGILENGGYSYLCRVCSLDLSENEYSIINSNS